MTMPTRWTWIVIVAACLAGPALAEDWPQAGANPARTSHVADEPRPPYELLWNRTFDGEVFTHTNQPIFVDGVLYVASNNGIVHALDPETGDELWAADVHGPVAHALAGDDEHIYAATLAGTIVALDRANGEPAWSAELSRRGFSVAPLLVDGAVLAGNRDGWFYAVSAADGELLWRHEAGAPIVQTAAAADGRVVFVDSAMIAWCLARNDGAVLWQVGPIPGGSVRDYYPVIHRGRVVLRTAEAGARELYHNPETLQRRFWWPMNQREQASFKAEDLADIPREQDMLVEYHEQFPFVRSLTILELADGSEPVVSGVHTGCANTGNYPPPCVAADGNLYTMCRTSAANSGFINITHLYLGHLDIETGRMDEPLLCGWREVGNRLFDVPGINDTSPWKMISDETASATSGGYLLFGLRNEGGAGAIDVRTREQFDLPGFAALSRTDLQSSCPMIAISGRYIAYVGAFRHVVCIGGAEE